LDDIWLFIFRYYLILADNKVTCIIDKTFLFKKYEAAQLFLTSIKIRSVF